MEKTSRVTATVQNCRDTAGSLGAQGCASFDPTAPDRNVPGQTRYKWSKATEAEVAAIFEVPLRFLMSSENHLRHSRQWQGKERYFYAMAYGERYIWGVTAGILRNLYEKIYG